MAKQAPNSWQQNEREARKAYVRRRQTIVFSIVGTLLAAVLVFAILVYTRVIDLQPSLNVAKQPNYGVEAPCAAKDKNGKPMKWVDNSQVPVRVLNGTGFRGMAGAVGEALKNRQFDVRSVTNYTKDSNVQRTTIYFGEQAINNAYTLAANFDDAIMVMDDRTDRLVDVVLGASFNKLRDQKDLKQDGDTIKDIPGCVSVDTLKKAGLPKNYEHTAVN